MIFLRPIRFDPAPIGQGQLISANRAKVEIGQLGIRHRSLPLNIQIEFQSNNG
jgi:hypothetical protein